MPYPKHPTTIGEHILKRRCELELFQKDVGKQIGVCAWTIMNWEKGYSAPEVQHYPGIITFLGYEPFSRPRSLGNRIVTQRQRLGWTRKYLAAHLEIDEGTIAAWEKNQAAPTGVKATIINNFLTLGEPT